mgnify:CR=1 FL=1
MYDSSIHAQRKNGNWVSDRTYKVEMVTPILHYPDIELLQELVRQLRKAGGLVNDSTGLHNPCWRRKLHTTASAY